MKQPPSPGRVAGIDFGTVRIGVAVSDPDRMIASPYENYVRRSRDLDARYFRQLAESEKIVLFVLGLPIHLDGRKSAKSEEVRGFGRWLETLTGVPVTYFDERFTSVEAENLLLQAEFTKKRRKKRMDMLAAQILLTAFLESDSKGNDLPGSLEDRE